MKIDYLNRIIVEPLDVMKFLRESEDLRDDICPSVGKEIGNFLYFLVIASNSKKIIEVGTSIGYSTSWLGLAAKKINGHVYTIDISERLMKEAKLNISLMNLEDNISFIHGFGEEVLVNLPNNIDMIFIDGATKSYDKLFELSLKKLKKGGLLIFEDILFSVSGKRKIQKDMMNDFNIKISSDNRIEKSFLNIGDGLLLCLKK